MTDRHERHTVIKAAYIDATRYAEGASAALPISPPHEIVEYRYGAPNRPIGFATAPTGFLRVDGRPDSSVDKEGWAIARHGVVVYPHPLTENDITAFELVPFLDEASRDDAVRQIADDMTEYRNEILSIVDEELDYLRSIVMQALSRLYPTGAHVGSTAEFVGQVLTRLRDIEPMKTDSPSPW